MLTISALLLSCDGNDSGAVGPGIASSGDSTLYVASGGQGDGTRENPFGSIQRALEVAFLNPAYRYIKVGIGEFTGSLRIRTGVTITGGLDPADDWRRTTSGETIIRGVGLDSLMVGLLIRKLSSPVILEDVTITTDSARLPGASAYGLYLQVAGNVVVRGCRVLAGAGAPGAHGDFSSPGIKGEDAFKQQPGLTPVPGGQGGSGGVANTDQATSGADGLPGFCADGTSTGGTGGLGGNGTSGSPGENGGNGERGLDGLGGASALTLEAFGPYLAIQTNSGDNGNDGQAGCGGGGGGGSPSVWNPAYAYDGFPGGGGGAGGGGGEGGHGGQGGGSSIAVFAYHSTVVLHDCRIAPSSGADGGDGGPGGIGGGGGKGGIVSGLFVESGPGGRGGNGGQGGIGGGGSGGWSIGILNAQSQIDTSLIVIQTGTPGQGGRGGADPSGHGQPGQAQDLFLLP